MSVPVYRLCQRRRSLCQWQRHSDVIGCGSCQSVSQFVNSPGAVCRQSLATLHSDGLTYFITVAGIYGMEFVSWILPFFSVRYNIYILRLCYDVSVHLSVCLSVTEVHWRIIANLGFKFRSKFTVHCGRSPQCAVHAGKRGGVISRYASHC